MKMLAIKFKDGWYVSLEELFPLKTEKDVRDLADALGIKLKDTSKCSPAETPTSPFSGSTPNLQLIWGRVV